MKPQRQLVAERPVAQHCPELLRKGPGQEALLPLLERMGPRLARRLNSALAPLLGEAPVVSCSSPRESDMASLVRSTAKLAANSQFMVGPMGAPMLVSIEAEPVLRIVDRAFGGKGEAPVPMPASFPMAAELMIARLEKLMAGHIAQAAAGEGSGRSGGAPAIVPVKRDASLALLSPFPESLPLAVMNVEVDDGSVLPWLMTIAMPMATLARLFGFSDTDTEATGQPALRRPPASATSAPFADLPLTLSALVVDMKVSFATIASLQPGQILPVTVARQVPLKIDGQTVAHGTIGAVDEHVAIQLSSAFSDQRKTAP